MFMTAVHMVKMSEKEMPKRVVNYNQEGEEGRKV